MMDFIYEQMLAEKNQPHTIVVKGDDMRVNLPESKARRAAFWAGIVVLGVLAGIVIGAVISRVI